MAQKRKLTDEQIVGVVKQLEAWKAKFGGLEPNEATKLRHLEDENGRLKKLVAELASTRKC